MVQPEVTCEACGYGTVNIDAPEVRKFAEMIDLWVCDHCLYVWHWVQNNIESAALKASGRVHPPDRYTAFQNALVEVGKYATKTMLRKDPMPSPHRPVEEHNRFDSIIMGDDDEK